MTTDDLALWFTPQAIRDHYAEADPDPTKELTDEELVEVGKEAILDESLWEAYNEALRDAIFYVTRAHKEKNDRLPL